MSSARLWDWVREGGVVGRLEGSVKRRVVSALMSVAPYRARGGLAYALRHGRLPDTREPRLHSERMLVRGWETGTPALSLCCSKVDLKRVVASRAAELQLAIRVPETFWHGPLSTVDEALAVARRVDQPWILKPNNLGGGLVVSAPPEGSALHSSEVASFLRSAKETERAFRVAAPLAWRSAPGGFLLEERIGDGSRAPVDYKVHVFDGEPHAISVYTGRGDSLTAWHFDLGGKLLFKRGRSRLAPEPLPAGMLESVSAVSEPLSLGLPYTRIDFYWQHSQLWFGEVSPFGKMGGLEKHRELDTWLGGLWGGPEQRRRPVGGSRSEAVTDPTRGFPACPDG